jgi:hypothetical protein
MGAVLVDPWAIVDEHEIERGGLEARMLGGESARGRVVEQLTVPAAIGGAGLLERLVRRRDVLLPARPVAPALRHDESSHEEDDEKRPDDDQHDGEDGHAGDSKAALITAS